MMMRVQPKDDGIVYGPCLQSLEEPCQPSGKPGQVHSRYWQASGVKHDGIWNMPGMTADVL